MWIEELSLSSLDIEKSKKLLPKTTFIKLQESLALQNKNIKKDFCTVLYMCESISPVSPLYTKKYETKNHTHPVGIKERGYIYFKLHFKIRPADKNSILLLSHISRVMDQPHTLNLKSENMWASSCVHPHTHARLYCMCQLYSEMLTWRRQDGFW